MLGYQGVHHGIKGISSPLEWELFSKACDSFFPVLPTYTGEPFTRADFDALFGPYEAVTDMSSFFAMQLIAAYPEAKFILVERDMDEWYESMEEAIFSTTWGLRADLVINVLGPLYGLNGGKTIRKIMLGYYGVRNVDEMRRVAKDRYRQHYAEIRAAVPEERLLNFRLEDGWEPLCEFLGKEVPEGRFPMQNKREEHLQRVRQKQNMFFKHVAGNFAKQAIPYALGAGVVGLALWRSRCGAQLAMTLSKFRQTLAWAW
ncbi:Nad dependent epimerase [Pyrenophora seminiperda CCB06]|uniref:Nad dependent epimerase n=1 Tax=Pyrenophora seminiperda CCB06 TaxID=1302712 RepID=A0A3M7LUM8_9PLEO|nr:Nad dependent epimerase [Pyrenophora seminiperda CCB06]